MIMLIVRAKYIFLYEVEAEFLSQIS